MSYFKSLEIDRQEDKKYDEDFDAYMAYLDDWVNDNSHILKKLGRKLGFDTRGVK